VLEQAASIDQKVDGFRSMMASITITPETSGGGQSTIEGLNLAAVTLPLMLMKPELFSMLSMLIAEKKLSISEADVNLFSSEFHKLLSECHMASAKMACIEQSTPAGQPFVANHIGTQITVHKNPTLTQRLPKKAKRRRQCLFKETGAGYLIIETETGYGSDRAA
jgi:hypothetical protein